MGKLEKGSPLPSCQKCWDCVGAVIVEFSSVRLESTVQSGRCKSAFHVLCCAVTCCNICNKQEGTPVRQVQLQEQKEGLIATLINCAA